MTDWAAFGVGVGVGLLGVVPAYVTLHRARRRDAREQVDQARREETEAAHVEVTVRGNGGSIDVRIVNHTQRPLNQVELLSVGSNPPTPGEAWAVNPNLRPRTPTSCEVLPAQGHMSVVVWLMDEHGRRIHPEAVTYVLRFQDASGQVWEKSPGGVQRAA